jgi:phosphate transport system permease protein
VSAIAPSPLTRRNDRLRRRKVVNRVMEFLAILAAAIGVAILAIVVFKIVQKGLPALNKDLFTQAYIPYAPPGIPNGLANAFVGTIVIVACAAAMGFPVGVLSAVFLVEFAPRWVRSSVRTVLDILQGIPAIVLGLFYYEILVLTTHQERALWGSIALATMMLPLVARSTMEVLQLVPNSLREASLGLGIPRWRTTVGIILPQAVGGVVTGGILAVSRIAGEAAPLLFLQGAVSNTVGWNPLDSLQSVPVAILSLIDTGTPDAFAMAWAGALVITVVILVMNLGARWLAGRSRRKLGRL